MDDEQATRRAPVALSNKSLATAEGIALLKVLERKVFYFPAKIMVPLRVCHGVAQGSRSA
jgi:hypothetical protein